MPLIHISCCQLGETEFSDITAKSMCHLTSEFSREIFYPGKHWLANLSKLPGTRTFSCI